MDERERHWMTPEEAAERVDEEQLSELLRDLPALLADTARH